MEFNGKTVLIVDNDESTRRTVANVLKEAGYDVLEAVNGRGALHALAEREAQLVITELVLPEMDGMQLLTQLRKLHPEVKLIAMSGASRAVTYLSVARHLGASRVLRKPFEMDELLQAVSQALGS